MSGETNFAEHARGHAESEVSKEGSGPSRSKADDDPLFAPHRRRLLGMAYRMLGTMADAEDMVQEAWLRWHAASAGASIENPGAFLTRIVVRLCLDRLKSAQVRREVYVGPWLPEPVLDSAELSATAARGTENSLADDLSVALLLTLERLSPLERAAFLLHDVFDMDFSDVGQALERSAAACRQLASRARSRVRASAPRYQASREERERLCEAFHQAARSGDTAALAEMLAEDAVLLADGGGRVTAALRPILGRDKITRFLIGIAAKFPLVAGLRIASAAINGLPGMIFSDPGGIIQTVALELNRDNLIAAIYVVRNPEKLRHVASRVS
jgi:RNA polymerase sigma-70 factor, ECF subfamily